MVSWRGPSTVWENGGIRNYHWREVCFGDGFTTLPHPQDSMRGFCHESGRPHRALEPAHRRTQGRASRVAEPRRGPALQLECGVGYRPVPSGMLWFGSQFVHVSADDGNTWEVRSDDLTTNREDWQKQTESGGLTLDVTGAENFTSLVAIAPSPVQQGMVWVGSDDGRLHLTTDDGATWRAWKTG